MNLYTTLVSLVINLFKVKATNFANSTMNLDCLSPEPGITLVLIYPGVFSGAFNGANILPLKY